MKVTLFYFTQFLCSNNFTNIKGTHTMFYGCISKENNGMLLENVVNSDTENGINKNDKDIKSLKEYIFLDDNTIEYDMAEMYLRYKCYLVECDIKNVKDYDNCKPNERNNFNLDIHDKQIFSTKKKNANYELKNTEDNINQSILEKNIDKYFYQNILFNTGNRISSKQKEFYYLFNIIQQDFIDVLNYGLNYFCDKNDFIKNILIQLQSIHHIDNKVFYLINILKKLTDPTMQKFQIIGNDRNSLIHSILFNHQFNVLSDDYIQKNICAKYIKLLNIHDNQNLTEQEIFRSCIFNINKLDNITLRLICGLGLKNLFLKYKNEAKPIFYFILVLLYTYNFEEKTEYFDWQKTLIKFLSVSFNLNIQDISKQRYLKLTEQENTDLAYKLFFAMNSKNITKSLNCYNELQKNINELHYINYIIELVNIIKCRIFSISLNE